MTSHQEFGLGTKGTQVAEVFSEYIRGRNVVITGVSPRSLGETLALTIAAHSPSCLILASRTSAKLEEVAKAVQTNTSTQPVTVVLDLASQQSIRAAASQIRGSVDKIDILINNAAVVSSERQETKEGLELQFGVNHVGHFLLTSLLMPLLTRKGSRVVNVTSLGYRLSPVRFHDYNFEGKSVPSEELPPASIPSHLKPDLEAGRPYTPFCAYGQSKTANILHCVALNEKYGSRGVRAFAVHPGSIWTDLSRNLSPEDLKIIEGTATEWINADQGTSTILVAAFDPKMTSSHEHVLLSDCQLVDAAATARDPQIADRLWELSERLTAEPAKL